MVVTTELVSTISITHAKFSSVTLAAALDLTRWLAKPLTIIFTHYNIIMAVSCAIEWHNAHVYLARSAYLHVQCQVDSWCCTHQNILV